jgi:hypothetical protein
MFLDKIVQPNRTRFLKWVMLSKILAVLSAKKRIHNNIISIKILLTSFRNRKIYVTICISGDNTALDRLLKYRIIYTFYKKSENYHKYFYF